jgi:hypothetical protein
MFVAYLFDVAFAVATSIGLSLGVGTSGLHKTKENIYRVGKVVYVLQLTYYSAVFFVKLSILLLYLRLSMLPAVYHANRKLSRILAPCVSEATL